MYKCPFLILAAAVTCYCLSMFLMGACNCLLSQDDPLVYDDSNYNNRLQAMQIYKGKIDEQLEQVRTNKYNLLALRDAQSVISPYVEKLNLNRPDFDELVGDSYTELIQILHQEQNLKLKSSILSSSIDVLTQRGVFQGHELLVKSSTSYIPQCVCFDMKTGQGCKGESLPNDYQIEELNLDSGLVVKNLSRSYDYIPKSCSEYLTNFYNGKTGNGFYLVRPIASLPEFPVYCDMKNGGWIFVNGILTSETPDKMPLTPITPDLTGSTEFTSLFSKATQIKSNIGDECVKVHESLVHDYHEKVMKYMCTINGFSLVSAPSKFISFFQYWIR